MTERRSLVLVDDEQLLDELLGLAAAAGCELECVPDVAAARAKWAAAPLVIVDEAAAARCRDARLARRDRLVLVCADDPAQPTWQLAVDLGAERVLRLPGGEQWLAEAMADVVEGPPGRQGRVLAVVGGRGGAGASVFVAAVGLAALRRDRNALLVDCDPLAGGLDLVLGAEHVDGLRWPELRVRSGRVPVSSLHAALPARTSGDARLTMLSGARRGHAPEPDAVAAVVEAGRRAGEIVACDLPRDLAAAAQVVLDVADLAVLVVPAEVRACVAARKLAERVLGRGVAARALVRGPAPGGLRADEVAEAVGLPLLWFMPAQPGLAKDLEEGVFALRRRGPLACAANAVLDVLTEAARPMAASRPESLVS